MATADIAPSPTLYINNLNEKVKKDVLKKSLYSVFSQFGKIIDMVACRGVKLRGQAWVVFADVGSATNAMRQMQGFPFYDKPMRIAFAKQKSDVIAKKDGTFKPREKKRALEPNAPVPQAAQIAPGAPAFDAPNPLAAPMAIENGAAAAPPPPKAARAEPVNMVPSNVLFAQDLPEECNDMMLSMLFQQYSGFREVMSRQRSALASGARDTRRTRCVPRRAGLPLQREGGAPPLAWVRHRAVRRVDLSRHSHATPSSRCSLLLVLRPPASVARCRVCLKCCAITSGAHGARQEGPRVRRVLRRDVLRHRAPGSGSLVRSFVAPRNSATGPDHHLSHRARETRRRRPGRRFATRIHQQRCTRRVERQTSLTTHTG